MAERRGTWARYALLLVALFAIEAVATAQSRMVPAHYLDGALPPIPFQAVGGGEVLLELAIDSRGNRFQHAESDPPLRKD